MKKILFSGEKGERTKSHTESLNENKNTKYIFITLSTYIMSPFDFIYAWMSRNDTVKIDIGALTYRLRIQ